MKRIHNLSWTGIGRAVLIPGLIVAGLFRMESQAAAPVVTPLGAYGQALQAPARLTADAFGQLYVTESQDGRVMVFDAFGRLASVKEGLAGPLGMAVDGDGQIYLAEEKTGSISVFDPQWNLLYKLGNGDGEFSLPNYIALESDPGGTKVYVTDSAANLIKVYQNGAQILSFGGQDTNTFSFPAGICLSPAGELFIVDQNNDRVQVYDRNGAYLRQFTLVIRFGMALGSAGGRSQGIATDSQGRVYVADSFQGLVKVFDAQGLYLTRFGGFGEGAGKLRMPAGLAMDAFNRLFVASLNNSRVEIFGLDSFLHFIATPSNNLMAEGANFTLSVIAGGSGPFSWQWRRDGADLIGQTSATLSLAGLAWTDSGKYSVVANGTTISPDANLTVLQPPAITQAPADLTQVAGSDATFSVTAAGSPVLAYQWQKDGRDLEGETSATLILSQVQDATAGTYSIVVSNAVGTATATAQLTVLDSPVISQNPADLIVAVGSDATFTVAATGNPAPTYQWQKGGMDLAGETSATLTLLQVQELTSGAYSVVVSNPAGSAMATAKLTVLNPPVITQGPASLSVVVGSDATFSVAATGSLPLTYQWQLGGADLAGEITNTLALHQVQDANAGTYSVVVSNPAGTATASALLTLTHPPVVQDVVAKTKVNTSLVLTVTQLLANASSPDGSPLTVSAVSSPSTFGGLVTLTGNTVTYTPARKFVGDDSFNFTVKDSNGNSTKAKVLVAVTVPRPRITTASVAKRFELNFEGVTEWFELNFEGVTGVTYTVQRTSLIEPQEWESIGQATVESDIGTFIDLSPPVSGAVYRIQYP